MPRQSSRTVFISHVSEENVLATRLKDALLSDFKRSMNVFVSSDLGSIELGTDWMNAIERAIKSSALLMVLCSQSSIRRPWVFYELGAAWMRKIPIIPVCHTDLTPADLPMPLTAREGIEASSSNGLERLYGVVAKQLNLRMPKADLTALAEQVRHIETTYAGKQEVTQYEYHIDLLLPPPGKLSEDRIPPQTPVESEAKALELFGLGYAKNWTWGDLEKAARRGHDTRWLKELHKCVQLASNNQKFRPVQAIFHTEAGSYQPDLARVEWMPNGSRRFHVHFVNTVVLPLFEVPNQFGVLATLLRLGLRFRYEVIEKYQDLLQVARSWTEPQKDKPSLLTQVRTAIETIESDAYSRGAENLDRDSIVRLFERKAEQERLWEISQSWEQIRARLVNADHPCTIEEARDLLERLREINYEFMVLGTRRYHEWVKELWPRRVAESRKLHDKVHRRRVTSRSSRSEIHPPST